MIYKLWRRPPGGLHLHPVRPVAGPAPVPARSDASAVSPDARRPPRQLLPAFCRPTALECSACRRPASSSPGSCLASVRGSGLPWKPAESRRLPRQSGPGAASPANHCASCRWEDPARLGAGYIHRLGETDTVVDGVAVWPLSDRCALVAGPRGANAVDSETYEPQVWTNRETGPSVVHRLPRYRQVSSPLDALHRSRHGRQRITEAAGSPLLSWENTSVGVASATDLACPVGCKTAGC